MKGIIQSTQSSRIHTNPPMARFADLPVEIVKHVCQDLILESKPALAKFCTTSKPILDAGAPILWHSLKIVFECEDLSSNFAVERLEALATLAQAVGVFRNTISNIRSLCIHSPCLFYEPTDANPQSMMIDCLLYSLLNKMPALKRLELDLCMAHFPLNSTMKLISSRLPTLNALVVNGVSAQSLELQTASPHLKFLAIGNMGCELRLDLSAFPALTHLHLGIDLAAPRVADVSAITFPSSLWSTLHVLILECFEWSSYSELVKEIRGSLNVSFHGLRIRFPAEIRFSRQLLTQSLRAWPYS